MKLELKHLAPYLPYGLRAINLHGKEVEIMGLSNGNNSVSNHLWVFRENDKTGNYFQGYLYECKPLLHPLSRLIETINHNGNEIMPFIELLKSNCFRTSSFDEQEYHKWKDHYNPNTGLGVDPNSMMWNEVKNLFELHFDVFGLIEKGLAEPIETSKAKGE